VLLKNNFVSSEIPTCDSPVDITFIVDSSGSISRTNYKREKAFINAIAQSFGISRTQSRAALVLFSSSASVKIRFADYASTEAFQVNFCSLFSNNYIFFHCGLRRLFHVLLKERV